MFPPGVEPRGVQGDSVTRRVGVFCRALLSVRFLLRGGCEGLMLATSSLSSMRASLVTCPCYLVILPARTSSLRNDAPCLVENSIDHNNVLNLQLLLSLSHYAVYACS